MIKISKELEELLVRDDISNQIFHERYISVNQLIFNGGTPNSVRIAYAFDGSYVGTFNEHLIIGIIDKFQITPQRAFPEATISKLGWSDLTNKWYAWNRATYNSFTIGSQITKKDLGYIPDNKDEFLIATKRFWEDAWETPRRKKDVIAIHDTEFENVYEDEVEVMDEKTGLMKIHSEIKKGGKLLHGVRVSWTYTHDVPNETLRGQPGGNFTPYPKNWGRGEWTALTMDDAKQMAMDFVRSLS